MSYSLHGMVSVLSKVTSISVKRRTPMDASAKLWTESLIVDNKVGNCENWIQNSSSKE